MLFSLFVSLSVFNTDKALNINKVITIVEISKYLINSSLSDKIPTFYLLELRSAGYERRRR